MQQLISPVPSISKAVQFHLMIKVLESSPIQEYAISIEEFTNKNHTFEIQSTYEHISRSSFTPFLIDSFRAAKGSIFHQLVYCDWIRVNTGFNYRVSVNNFLEAGGWSCLTDIEKTFFLKAHQRVKVKDHKKINDETFDEDFINGFEAFVSDLAGDDGDYSYLARPLQTLRGIPRRNLVRNLESFVKR